MSDYEVKINFNDGTYDYDLPLAFHLADPEPGIKNTIIRGKRGDGVILIPGGKESPEIKVRGKLVDEDYKAITTLMNEMRMKVTTKVATLTLKHKEGINWIVDWAHTVRRTEEIRFPQSFRVSSQEYEISFLILVF